jgi:hypothetical protein
MNIEQIYKVIKIKRVYYSLSSTLELDTEEMLLSVIFNGNYINSIVNNHTEKPLDIESNMLKIDLKFEKFNSIFENLNFLKKHSNNYEYFIDLLRLIFNELYENFNSTIIDSMNRYDSLITNGKNEDTNFIYNLYLKLEQNINRKYKISKLLKNK